MEEKVQKRTSAITNTRHGRVRLGIGAISSVIGASVLIIVFADEIAKLRMISSRTPNVIAEALAKENVLWAGSEIDSAVR